MVLYLSSSVQGVYQVFCISTKRAKHRLLLRTSHRIDLSVARDAVESLSQKVTMYLCSALLIRIRFSLKITKALPKYTY